MVVLLGSVFVKRLTKTTVERNYILCVRAYVYVYDDVFYIYIG